MPLGRAMTTSTPVRSACARDAFALELGLLVDVAWTERRVLVRRRMLDVAVYADGAAVDDAARPRRSRRIDDRSPGLRVHRAVDLVGETCLAVERGDVVDDLHAARSASKRIGVAQIALDLFDRR
jgi:hypothetical protein